MKHDLGSLQFSAQYQQRPVPLEGNLVRRRWIPVFDAKDIPSLIKIEGARIIQSWDIAGTNAKTSDWSVCTTWIMIKRDGAVPVNFH